MHSNRQYTPNRNQPLWTSKRDTIPHKIKPVRKEPQPNLGSLALLRSFKDTHQSSSSTPSSQQLVRCDRYRQDGEYVQEERKYHKSIIRSTADFSFCLFQSPRTRPSTTLTRRTTGTGAYNIIPRNALLFMIPIDSEVLRFVYTWWTGKQALSDVANSISSSDLCHH